MLEARAVAVRGVLRSPKEGGFFFFGLLPEAHPPPPSPCAAAPCGVPPLIPVIHDPVTSVLSGVGGGGVEPSNNGYYE